MGWKVLWMTILKASSQSGSPQNLLWCTASCEPITFSEWGNIRWIREICGRRLTLGPRVTPREPRREARERGVEVLELFELYTPRSGTDSEL